MDSYVNNQKLLRIGIDGMVTPIKRTGVGRYLECLLLALNENTDKNNFTVFLGSNQDDLARLLPKQFDIKKDGISTEQSLMNCLRLQFVLPFTCKRNAIDILHIPNEKLMLFKSCPVVLTIHDVGDFRVSKRKDFIRRVYRRLFMPVMLNRADHIIVVSERTKADLIELFNINPEKITVIYEGISHNFRNMPDSQTKKDICKKFGIKHKFFLFVGEISKRKNLEILVKAYAES